MSDSLRPSNRFAFFNIGLQEQAYANAKIDAPWKRLRDTTIKALTNLNPLVLGVCELGGHEQGLDHLSLQRNFESSTHDLHLSGSYAMYTRKSKVAGVLNVTEVSPAQSLCNIMPPSNGNENQQWRKAAAWTLNIEFRNRTSRVLIIIGHAVSGKKRVRENGTGQQISHRATSTQKKHYWQALHQHANDQMLKWLREADAASLSLPDGVVLMGDFNLDVEELNPSLYHGVKCSTNGWKGDHIWVYGWTLIDDQEAEQKREEIRSDGQHRMVTTVVLPVADTVSHGFHKRAEAEEWWKARAAGHQEAPKEATMHKHSYLCHANFIFVMTDMASFPDHAQLNGPIISPSISLTCLLRTRGHHHANSIFDQAERRQWRHHPQSSKNRRGPPSRPQGGHSRRSLRSRPRPPQRLQT